MTREEKLEFEFNKYFISRFSIEDKNYYKKLTTKDFIELKTLLSNINNIIMLKLTLSFINTIESLCHLSKEQKEKITNDIQSINPNTNGFDIEIENPVKIVAEIKGNIPIKNGEQFGSAQKNGILNDFNSLMNGKLKSKVETFDYYKFFVLPDTEKTRLATNRLLESIKKKNEYKNFSFDLFTNSIKELNKNTIYIVFEKIEK